MATVSNKLITAVAFTTAGTAAMTFVFGAVSQPSPSHLMVRAMSEHEDQTKMKPRLTKHPSGAYEPKLRADGR